MMREKRIEYEGSKLKRWYIKCNHLDTKRMLELDVVVGGLFLTISKDSDGVNEFEDILLSKKELDEFIKTLQQIRNEM